MSIQPNHPTALTKAILSTGIAVSFAIAAAHAGTAISAKENVIPDAPYEAGRGAATLTLPHPRRGCGHR